MADSFRQWGQGTLNEDGQIQCREEAHRSVEQLLALLTDIHNQGNIRRENRLARTLDGQGVGYDVGRNPSGWINAPEDAEFGGGRELGSRVERSNRHSTSDLGRAPLQVRCKNTQYERSIRQRVQWAAFVGHAPRSLSSATSHCCRSDGTTRPSRARLYQASSALTCQV